MKFSYGVVAKITFKETLTHRGYETFCSDSIDVYDYLVDRFGHNVAANAEGWVELACIGEWYEDDEFEIEIMEE